MSKHSTPANKTSIVPAPVPAAEQVLVRQGVVEERAGKSPIHEPFIAAEPGGLTPSPPPPDEAAQKRIEEDQPRRDFTSLGVHSGTVIYDDDAARSLATQWLINELAPLLGLDPRKIEIRVNAEAESRTNARGANGLMEGGTIYLHPARYQPESNEGRRLLTHEAVHVAQRQIADHSQTSAKASIAEAEREADRLAVALAESRPAPQPRRALPLLASAAKSTQGPEQVEDLASLVNANYAEELAQIESALSYSVFDWKITDGDVETVLRILEPLPLPIKAALIGALKAPFPERLADNFSESHFKRYRSSMLAVYYALLSRRQIGKLPDDPFAGMSWSALSPEEHFALYHILPAFLSVEKGKTWYSRSSQRRRAYVMDIVSVDPNYNEATEGKKATETEEKRRAEREQNKKELEKDDLRSFLDFARNALSYSWSDWAVTDREALSVLDGFANLSNNPPQMRAVVETLENEGLMDRLIDHLPVRELYTDVGITAAGKAVNRRKLFLQIASFRPARKNAEKAEELLSYGLLDWAITDEEAFLAQQLVKALPLQVRQGFYAAKGGKYATRLDEELSLSMKKGQTANYYQGGEGGSDLRSIQAQLLEDGLWSKQQMSRLRMLIQMLIAAGEGLWIFAQSKERFLNFKPFQELYHDPEFFKRVVEAFRLYVPKDFLRPDGLKDAGREEYTPEKVEGKPFGTDNFFWATIVQGLDFVFRSNRIQIFKESIGGEGLDFGEFQDLTGGSFLGAEFQRASKVAGQQRTDLLDNSVRWDLDHGILEMRASQLEILSINFPQANLKIQTGATNIRGLHLHLEYPATESKQTTTTLRMRIDSFEVNDALLISSDSMVGFEQISLKDFFIDLSPDTPQSQRAAASEDIALGSIFFTPLFSLLKIKGAGIFGANLMTSRAGELSQGFFEPATPLNLTVTAGELLVKGMTTSGGQHIDTIRLDNLALRGQMAQGRAGYVARLKDERTRLEKRIEELRKQNAAKTTARPRHYLELETERSLTLQLKSVTNEIANIEEATAEEQRLKQLSQTSALSPADDHKLKRLTAYLSGIDTGGMALDVGHAEVKGISGRVAMGDVTLDDLHGYGRSGGAVLGTLFDSNTFNRILRGPEYRGTIAGVEAEGDPVAFMVVRQIEASAIDVQGTIPTAVEAAAAVAKTTAAIKQDPGNFRLPSILERQQARLAAAQTYWEILGEPPELIKAEDHQRFNQARNLLLAEKEFHADKIILKDAGIELTKGESGVSVGVEAGTLDAYNLQSQGLKIREAHGQQVRVGARITGGLSNLLAIAKKRENLRGGELSADQLQFLGISHEESGLGLQALNIRGLGADLTRKGGDTEVGLKATSIEALGASWMLTERVLRFQQQKLLEKVDPPPTTAEMKQLKDLEYLLDAFEVNQEMISEAKLKLADPQLTPEKRKSYEAQLKDTQEQLAYWQRQAELKKFTISDLDIGVAGLGDLLSEDFSIDRAVKDGIRVAGRGKGQQIASGVTATGARVRLGVGEDKELPGGGVKSTANREIGVEEIKTGPIRGEIEVAQDHISLTNFGIETIELQNFQYIGGESRIWSPAKNTVNKLSITAKLNLTPVDEKLPEADRYVSNVELKHFEIESIIGNDLYYLNGKSGLSVHVTTGKLRTIFAENVNIDLPKDGPLKIHGGKAKLGQAEDIRAAATTAGGLAVNGLVNASALDADFAEDGTVTANLLSLNLDAGKLKQKDLDVKFNAKAKGLRLTLTPGAKGYKDAEQKYKVDELSAHAEGSKGKTKFAGDIDKASTGEIIKRADGTIIAPAIELPDIKLTQFYFDNEKYKIDVPAGQTITLSNTKLGVKLEPNKSGKSDDFPYDRILIQKLNVPRIDFRGLTFEWKEKGLTLTLPEKESGYLLDLNITPDSQHPDGFIIEPNNNWNMLGKAGFSEAQFKDLSADMPDVFVKTADVKAEGFSLEFIGAGETKLDLKTITAENIEGDIAGSKFSVLRGDTRHKNINPRLVIHDTKKDKDGNITFGNLELKGFRYQNDDLGLIVDLMDATLPKREDGKAAFEDRADGSVFVPQLKINEAYFRIADVLNIGGKKSSKKGVDYGPNWSFLDNLNGHLNFDVHAVGGTMLNLLDSEFQIRIPITNGQFDFSEVEDEAFGFGDAVVDFTYAEPKYGGAIPGSFNINIWTTHIWWNLTEEENVLARNNQIRISTFFKHKAQTPAPMPWHEPSTEPSITALRYYNVDVDLRLPGETKIELGDAGYILMGGGDGLPFRLQAQSNNPDAYIKSLPLNLTANIKEVDLKTDLSGGKLKTGQISIASVGRTTLTFEPGKVGLETMDLPKTLEGTLDDATANDISWTPGPKGEKK